MVWGLYCSIIPLLNQLMDANTSAVLGSNYLKRSHSPCPLPSIPGQGLRLDSPFLAPHLPRVLDRPPAAAQAALASTQAQGCHLLFGTRRGGGRGGRTMGALFWKGPRGRSTLWPSELQQDGARCPATAPEQAERLSRIKRKNRSSAPGFVSPCPGRCPLLGPEPAVTPGSLTS